jgi:mannose-6-phosphate isomerase-like protein (cupin superfamily)
MVGLRTVDGMDRTVNLLHDPVNLLDGAALHLGLDATATPMPDFSWAPEALAGYVERFAGDGDEGRLVVMFHSTESWDSWERHPAGEEVVILASGRIDLLQEVDGVERRVAMTPGTAVVNPKGVWHTADVHEPGTALFITPGRGTEHRPR